MKKEVEKELTAEQKMENTLLRTIHAYEYDCVCYPVNINKISDINNAKKLLESIRFYRGNVEEVYYNPASNKETKDLANSFLNKLAKDEIELSKFLKGEKDELEIF